MGFRKSSVPNSILAKTWKLLKSDMSFSTGHLLIDKNHQKLIIKIIDQCPVYLILKRSLKNLCVKDSLIFWISTMWYTHYNLVFDKKNSNTHVLINLSKNTRQALDEDSFGRGIFVNLQKAFDTVDHKFLLHKLE